MTSMKPHPAQRYSAPSAIQRGVPLKEMMDRRLVKLIGESFSDDSTVEARGLALEDPVEKSEASADRLNRGKHAEHIEVP